MTPRPPGLASTGAGGKAGVERWRGVWSVRLSSEWSTLRSGPPVPASLPAPLLLDALGNVPPPGRGGPRAPTAGPSLMVRTAARLFPFLSPILSHRPACVWALESAAGRPQGLGTKCSTFVPSFLLC